MYTASDFNIENAPKEMVQYVLDMVEDFELRYQHALSVIGRDRCPLKMADLCLYCDIETVIDQWCNNNDDQYENYDIEEIFG